MKTSLAGLLVAGLATTALAQTTEFTEFYVVHELATKKCTIVSQKPTRSSITVVDGRSFKTRVEAETAMKTMKVCTTN